MSENLHNIDALFKRAIDEHEDTPSQKVWDAIDKNLDKKKVITISKKYNKLKWAAAILLLFSSGMAMYVWQTRMKNKELVKENNINKGIKTNKEIINNDDKKSTQEIKTEIEKNSELQNDNTTNSSGGSTLTTTSAEKEQEENSTRGKINTDKGKSKLTMVVTQKEEQPDEPGKNNKEQQQKNKESILADNETIKEQDNFITPLKSSDRVPMIFNNYPQWNNILRVLPTNPFNYTPGTALDKEVAIENNNTNPRTKKSVARATKPSLFSATLFFSPEFVAANVRDDHPRYREDDRHQIKNSEKTRSSSSVGVLINYAAGNNWLLQSGVSLYTRVTDINAKTIYARPDNGGNINYRLSCSAGAVYVPLKSGANPVQGDSTKILSAKNTLQYISVPLGVKYRLGKGRFNLVPGAGISANILAKGKVETVIAPTGGNESSSTNNIEGLKSTYFNSEISLGAQFGLTKKIALNFTPTAKLGLSSINKDAPVKTNLNSFGLSAGITIKL